jgi:hypothetical protein
MLAFNRLPMLFHPLFGTRAFEKVTDDGFFISIEAWDPKFNPIETERFLKQIGATNVELVARDGGRVVEGRGSSEAGASQDAKAR